MQHERHLPLALTQLSGSNYMCSCDLSTVWLGCLWRATCLVFRCFILTILVAEIEQSSKQETTKDDLQHPDIVD